MTSGTIIGIVTFVYLGAFSISIVGRILGKDSLDRPSFYAAVGGFVLHTAGILLRWRESYSLGIGHVPLSNFYESLVFCSWAPGRMTLFGIREEARNRVLSFVTPAAALVLGYASFSPRHRQRHPAADPGLEEQLAAIHVITCFFGYASFAVASVFGIFLLRTAARRECIHGQRCFNRCVMIGFVFFTVGILTGSVWAQVAWADTGAGTRRRPGR
jgi:ABC-type transport system involved in cytochrome c biogenesis permease subunit